MSDITAAQWSSQTVAKLQEYEQACSDIDLFCVGYLIPPVEILETNHAERSGKAQRWHTLFVDFIEQCMMQDQLAEEDQRRIRIILNELEPVNTDFIESVIG